MQAGGFEFPHTTLIFFLFNDRLPPTDLIGLWIEANFILLQHL